MKSTLKMRGVLMIRDAQSCLRLSIISRTLTLYLEEMMICVFIPCATPVSTSCGHNYTLYNVVVKLVQKKPLLILVWRISGPSQQGKHYDKVVSPSRSAVVIYIPPWRALKSLPRLRQSQPLHKYELKVRQGIILSPASHQPLSLSAYLKEAVTFMAPWKGLQSMFHDYLCHEPRNMRKNISRGSQAYQELVLTAQRNSKTADNLFTGFSSAFQCGVAFLGSAYIPPYFT